MDQSFKPYMKHFGHSLEEQTSKNQPLLKWLEAQLKKDANLSDEAAQANRDFLEDLKHTIDNARSPGQKLFSHQ